MALIFIPLPCSEVPITLQTMFIYLAGAILEVYLGVLSQLIYLLIGVAGLPIFARGGSGLSVLIGLSGGYIIGFIMAAFVIGELKKVKKRIRVVVYLLGCGH